MRVSFSDGMSGDLGSLKLFFKVLMETTLSVSCSTLKETWNWIYYNEDTRIISDGEATVLLISPRFSAVIPVRKDTASFLPQTEK